MFLRERSVSEKLQHEPECRRPRVQLELAHSVTMQEPIEHSEKFMRDVHRSAHILNHNLHATTDLRQIDDLISGLFQELVEPIIRPYNDNDYVSIQANHFELEAGPIYISYRKKKQMRYEDFVETIASVSQSNKTFLIDGQMELIVRIVRNMRGGSHKRNVAVKTLEELYANKRSVVTIKNNSNACGYLALTLGMWLLKHPETVLASNKKKRRKFDELHKDKNGELIAMAERDFGSWGGMGFDLDEEMATEDLKIIQESYKNEFQIIVIRRPTNAVDSKVLNKYFSGDSTATEKVILEYVECDKHYNLVKSLASFYGFYFWCYQCNKGYDTQHSHFCSGVCKICRTTGICQQSGQNYNCDGCGIEWFSEK